MHKTKKITKKVTDEIPHQLKQQKSLYHVG